MVQGLTAKITSAGILPPQGSLGPQNFVSQRLQDNVDLREFLQVYQRLLTKKRSVEAIGKPTERDAWLDWFKRNVRLVLLFSSIGATSEFL